MTKVREFVLDTKMIDTLSELRHQTLQNFVDLTKEIVRMQLAAQELIPETEGDEELLSTYLSISTYTALEGMDSLVEGIKQKSIREIFLKCLNDSTIKKAMFEVREQQGD